MMNGFLKRFGMNLVAISAGIVLCGVAIGVIVLVFAAIDLAYGQASGYFGHGWGIIAGVVTLMILAAAAAAFLEDK